MNNGCRIVLVLSIIAFLAFISNIIKIHIPKESSHHRGVRAHLMRSVILLKTAMCGAIGDMGLNKPRQAICIYQLNPVAQALLYIRAVYGTLSRLYQLIYIKLSGIKVR